MLLFMKENEYKSGTKIEIKFNKTQLVFKKWQNFDNKFLFIRL